MAINPAPGQRVTVTQPKESGGGGVFGDFKQKWQQMPSSTKKKIFIFGTIGAVLFYWFVLRGGNNPLSNLLGSSTNTTAPPATTNGGGTTSTDGGGGTTGTTGPTGPRGPRGARGPAGKNVPKQNKKHSNPPGFKHGPIAYHPINSPHVHHNPQPKTVHLSRGGTHYTPTRRQEALFTRSRARYSTAVKRLLNVEHQYGHSKNILLQMEKALQQARNSGNFLRAHQIQQGVNRQQKQTQILNGRVKKHQGYVANQGKWEQYRQAKTQGRNPRPPAYTNSAKRKHR